MKFDVNLAVDDLRDVPAVARAAEEMGFDGIWTSETQHDPFFPLVVAAEHTARIELGTAIAVAFARSPTNIAHMAWDLADFSKGRFILGLGTQVKPHVERRFGMMWESPAPKLREAIQALRAVWDCWQNGTKLNFRGDFYKLTLMTDFFNPGPIEHPNVPIFIAGVNEHLCRLAGELCDGFHVHPLHTEKYLREFIIPTIQKGAEKTGRSREDLQLTSAAFIVTGKDGAELERNREAVRQQISFYASTPSYRPVLAMHGWGDTGQQLSRLAARKRWDEMPALISDEMLETFAVVGTYEDVARKVREKYDGLLDRVTYYERFRPGVDEDRWRQAAQAFQGAA